MRPDKPVYNLDLTNTDREPKQTKNSARNMTKYNLSDGNYRVCMETIHSRVIFGR